MGNGIVTKTSALDFESTYANLKETIEGNPKLKIVAELDHSAGASKAGLSLKPCRIIMFGNPQMGTPLMMSAITAGLDLPQKMLVYETENGDVKVSYNDPMFMKERHDIKGSDEILQKTAEALDKLSNAATANLKP